MKYFAELNDTNEVLSVLCVNDDCALTEQAGVDFLISITNHQIGGSDWKQSFKDGTRKNHAQVGMTYDKDRDAFIPHKSYDSWILNEATCRFDPPIERPDDGKQYNWNEDNTNWESSKPPE